jgi:hypothetical protein
MKFPVVVICAHAAPGLNITAVIPEFYGGAGLKQWQEMMSATEILKSAFTLALYVTATTTTLANAQVATFSEGEASLKPRFSNALNLVILGPLFGERSGLHAIMLGALGRRCRISLVPVAKPIAAWSEDPEDQRGTADADKNEHE